MAFLVRTVLVHHQMVVLEYYYTGAYSYFLKNGIPNAPLDLLDLLEGCSLVKAPDEKIYVA